MPKTTQAERDELNAAHTRFYQQPIRCAEPLTPAQMDYNARTLRLIPTGDAQRDRLTRARLRVRSSQS